MTKNELYAYTAGLIDADGYISIVKISKRGNYYAPVVKLAAVDYDAIDFLTKNYGGYTHKRKFIGENQKDAWQWEIKNMDATREFLEPLMPYLLLKKPRAKLVIEYCNTKNATVHPLYSTYEKNIAERRHAIYKELRKLNHRGLK
jgi:hypothetical protein